MFPLFLLEVVGNFAIPVGVDNETEVGLCESAVAVSEEIASVGGDAVAGDGYGIEMAGADGGAVGCKGGASHLQGAAGGQVREGVGLVDVQRITDAPL